MQFGGEARSAKIGRYALHVAHGRTAGEAPACLIYFVLGDIFLFLILLILINLYMTSSKFYMLAQHYKRYVLPLLLVFISEIVLVLYP